MTTGKARRGRRVVDPATPAMTAQTIAAAALDLIDADGLDAFSVRTLAAHLNVYPATIYWYIPNRDAILEQVVALVLGDIMPRVQRRSWQAFLRDVFGNFRAAIRAHPNIAPLIDSKVTSNADLDLDVLERLLGLLTRAGLSGDALVGAYNSVLVALVAFPAQELAPIPLPAREAWQRHVDTRISAISPEAHPTLARHLPLLSNRAFTLRWQNGVDAPMDSSFDIFVDVVIAGIERLIARTAPATTAAD